MSSQRQGMSRATLTAPNVRYDSKQGPWLGIAFLKGQFWDPHDDLVMTSTMGRFVHCEIVVGNGEWGKAYSAFWGVGGFVPSNSFIYPKQWCMFEIPLLNPSHLSSAIYDTVRAAPTYNQSDLWQCVIKAALPFEDDYVYTDPVSWKHGVFCSQAAVLILRRLLASGAVQLPPDAAAAIWASNSRGCSPNGLHRMLRGGIKKVF